MYHAHKQGAVCVFRTQAVWKQACLWSMALGPRSPSESVGICCYRSTKGDHRGAPSKEGDHCKAEGHSLCPGEELAVWH